MANGGTMKNNFAKNTVGVIKSEITVRDLHVALYGRNGTRVELQTLRNRLNTSRGVPNFEFIAECIAVIPSLHDISVRDLIGIK